jgi:prophage antirepressor-like protein
MAEIQPFCFENTVVRTILRGEEPWFVGKDVCSILELGNITEALRCLDEDERGSEILNTLGGSQEMTIISESGLYALIFKSRKPQAKTFRRWVTREVLPAIRKTGGYTLVPAKKEKLVTVDHRYTKNSLANPHGIRYHLDLTRVVTKPTRQSLEILTRLTGVDFSDIEISEELRGQHAWVAAFVSSCCQLDPQSREGSTRLYRAFSLWRQESGFELQDLPSQRAFGLCLKDRPDLAQRRAGDGVYWHGLRLKEPWRVRVAEAA